MDLNENIDSSVNSQRGLRADKSRISLVLKLSLIIANIDKIKTFRLKIKKQNEKNNMAGIGLKNFKYAKLNSGGEIYGVVKTLVGAIEIKVTLDLSEALLYADDALREQVSLFKSGTLTAGIDDDNDTVFAELLGKTVDQETGIVTSNSEDTPIYVGFGHIVPKMVGGVKKYKVEFFPKVKFKPFYRELSTCVYT